MVLRYTLTTRIVVFIIFDLCTKSIFRHYRHDSMPRWARGNTTKDPINNEDHQAERIEMVWSRVQEERRIPPRICRHREREEGEAQEKVAGQHN